MGIFLFPEPAVRRFHWFVLQTVDQFLVRVLYVQVGEVSGGGPTTFDFKQTCNPAVHRTRLVRPRFGVDPFHRWPNAYLLWSPGPIRAFDGKLGSRALRALSIPATGSVPASINPS